jgi:hypothetical protein
MKTSDRMVLLAFAFAMLALTMAMWKAHAANA